jgi:putative copper export protein
MLVKHILIVAMIGMGFVFNAFLRIGPMMSSNSGAAQAIARFGLYSKLMAACGVLVLLLTAFAQFE